MSRILRICFYNQNTIMSTTERPINKNAVQSIVNFLKTNLSKSDVPNIENEFKKDFIFAKRRSKGLKQKGKKKKIRTISRKEKKALGFYMIPRDSIKYSDIIPMHTFWTEYMSQIIETDKPIPTCASKGWESFTQSVYKADFHGSYLHVVRSKCPSYVGKKGICVMDTKNTFKILSENDLVTTIPKKDSVFEMCLKNIKITLFGKHLCARPAERSTKKVKSHLHPDLL